MRLEFNLKQIRITPACHIHLARNAEEYQGRYATGELYGALFDNQAEITSILPFPDRNTWEENEQIERRNEENLSNFNMDKEKLGWYMICYTRDFWNEIHSIKLYEVPVPAFRKSSTPASSWSTTIKPTS